MLVWDQSSVGLGSIGVSLESSGVGRSRFDPGSVQAQSGVSPGLIALIQVGLRLVRCWSGLSPVSVWGQSGSVWSHLGLVGPGLIRGQSRVIPGAVQGQSRVSPGSVQAKSGVSLGSFKNPSVVSFGPSWGRSLKMGVKRETVKKVVKGNPKMDQK